MSHNKYSKLHQRLSKMSDSVYDTSEGKELLNIIESGENKYLRLDRFESSAMDFTWIKRIEDCIPPLGEIVQNPKKTIQTLTEVVQIEKTKKVGRESVQHLSSHTQFIKTIDENGNVTPSKILNVYNDDFYAIYENRFIATLLRRLLIFVEKRYQFIIQNASLSDVKVLYVKNHVNIDGHDVEIESKVRYSTPADEDAAKKMRGYLKSIEDIRKYLKFYMNTEFMKILRRERDVRNPILQTNIIRKNPKYHKCYLLWLFIERYRDSGIEVKVEENFSVLSKKELRELNKLSANTFVQLEGKDMSFRRDKKTKKIKPKILKTYDDEIYKPYYYDGPVEFIRVDEKYREYSESLRDLNQHPTKALLEYEKEKYEDNKRRRQKTKEVDALLKRKENEKANYEKGEEEALAREKLRDEYVDALAEKEIREEAIEKVEKARKNLVREAKNLSPNKVSKKLDKALKDNPVKVEKPKEEKAPTFKEQLIDLDARERASKE